MSDEQWPERPVDVVVTRHDGRWVSCEPAFIGWTEDGDAMWKLDTVVSPTDRITCARLPGKSILVFPWQEEGS